MPLLKLIAEGVGPFEQVEIDFSDGNGKPHLGPHILAGVNGAGKSTILRSIAWVLDRGEHGFSFEDWRHSLSGHKNSEALLVGTDTVMAAGAPGSHLSILSRVKSVGVGTLTDRRVPWVMSAGNLLAHLPMAGYAPTRGLRYIPRPSLTKDPSENALSFDSTIDNEAIQAWILSVVSQAAIAETRRESAEQFRSQINRFTEALRLIYSSRVMLQVDYQPELHPRLIVQGKSLNFSQLPQGISSTVGWLADFMMRQSRFSTDGGLLLIDEIDAHLHPAWQRIILPAVRKALPGVLIIVTTHSPFVISSCPEARLHLLEVDNDGKARLARSIDAPFGESIFATMKDIFGVKSRFDPKTEKELNEWVELRDEAAERSLSQPKKAKLVKLTNELSTRSEELRAIVSPAARIPAKRANGKRKTS